MRGRGLVAALFVAVLLARSIEARRYVTRVAPRRPGVEVLRSYDATFSGYLIEAEPEVAEAIAREHGRDSVHEDAPARRNSVQSLPGDGALYHLDRLDSPLAEDRRFAYGADGSGVTIHAIDSSFFLDHDDLAGRISSTNLGPRARGEEGCAVDNPHGTSVASLAAGTTYGVAKGASIRGYAIGDCSGASSAGSLLAALDAIARGGSRPGVVVVSLGFATVHPPVDEAFDALVAAGFPVFVAAGNEPALGCGASPVVNGTRTFPVGASDRAMRIADFSTRGPCVRAYAPGEGVRGAWPGNAVAELSGTSVSAPIAAGIAATILQSRPGATPDEVYAELEALGSRGVLRGTRDGDRNLFLGSVPARANPAARGEGPGGVPDAVWIGVSSAGLVAAVALVAGVLYRIARLRRRPVGAGPAAAAAMEAIVVDAVEVAPSPPVPARLESDARL